MAERQPATLATSSDAAPDASIGAADRGSPLLRAVAVFGPLALVGVAVVADGVRLGLGQADSPGPGLWPVVIGVVWTAASVTAGVRSATGREPLARLDGLGKPVLGLLVATAFIALFSYVGFVVAIVVTMVLWLRLFSAYTWTRTIAVTALVAVLLYVLFAVIVGTVFPPSLIGLR